MQKKKKTTKVRSIFKALLKKKNIFCKYIQSNFNKQKKNRQKKSMQATP